jgi:DnaK suppressor protein
MLSFIQSFNKKPMRSDLVKKMQDLLEGEKARLEKELGDSAQFPNLGEKEDENASEVAQFSDNLSLEDELEKALRDVESALKMIQKGEYGTCKYCGSEIDERRLIARPTSTSCIQCKKTLTQEV